MFHKPDLGRIRRQNRASAEIVDLSGQKIDRLAASGIEMRGIRIGIHVYSHHYPLITAVTLENTLLVGKDYRTKAAVIESTRVFLDLGELCDVICQLIPLGLIKANPQSRVSFFLPGLGPHSEP